MSHNKHVIDGINKDVGIFGYKDAKDYYLSLAEGWIPYNPDPIVIDHDGVKTPEDEEQYSKEWKEGMNKAQKQYIKDKREAYKYLADHIDYWWD
jgi:hypothetical protein